MVKTQCLQAFGVFLLSVLLFSCSPSSTGIFSKKTPHERYAQGLATAGLTNTALGRSWLEAAEKSLRSPLDVKLPYQEAGYFAAEKPAAGGIRFQVTRGEKLTIALEKNPSSGFSIYLDLWQAAESEGGRSKLLIAADSAADTLQYTVKENAMLTLRLQPELLQSGDYNLRISTGPSLAFPIPSRIKSSVASLWGVDRDGGARRHEGIDIFAPFRSPAIAAGNGIVSRVNENNLGGKVVFLRLEESNVTLYYAHLDSQIARPGQMVQTGDTLGLTGNTGNARSTPSHLHFGIYTSGGAIDPYPFVNQTRKLPAKITASTSLLNKQARTTRKLNGLLTSIGGKTTATLPLEVNSVVTITAATENWYKVTLPDGSAGFISNKDLTLADRPLRKQLLKAGQPLLDRSDSTAARKLVLSEGSQVSVLGRFNDYYLVETSAQERGWLPANVL